MARAADWQAEFERQINEARPLLTSIATRIVGQDEAEDVVQTALMITWRQAPKLKGPQCYAKWATQVVKYSAIDVCRRRARHPSGPLPENLDELRPATHARPEDAESLVLGKIDQENARQVLDRMPLASAQMLLERDGLDMEYSDILARHGLDFTQLKNLLYRSRNRFRQEFARLGVGLAALLRFKPRPATAGAGTHAKAAAVKATLLPRLVVGGAAVIAIGAGATFYAVNHGAAPTDLDPIPVAAVWTSEPPASSASAASASPTPAPSASPTASLTATRPVSSTPAAPATPASSTPTSTAPTSAPPTKPSPTTVPSAPVARTLPAPLPTPSRLTAPTSPASAPKLGTGVSGGTNAVTDTRSSEATATPTCRSVSGSRTSVTWTITNSSNGLIRVGAHSGDAASGGAAIIAAGQSARWIQSAPAGSTSQWWLELVNSGGEVVNTLHYSGTSLASLPTCS